MKPLKNGSPSGARPKEPATATQQHRVKGWGGIQGHYPPIMEHQMKKSMENDMETGVRV